MMFNILLYTIAIYQQSTVEMDVCLFYTFVFLYSGKQSYLSGGRLNKKDGLTRCGDSHVKDKTS